MYVTVIQIIHTPYHNGVKFKVTLKHRQIRYYRSRIKDSSVCKYNILTRLQWRSALIPEIIFKDMYLNRFLKRDWLLSVLMLVRGIFTKYQGGAFRISHCPTKKRRLRKERRFIKGLTLTALHKDFSCVRNATEQDSRLVQVVSECATRVSGSVFDSRSVSG